MENFMENLIFYGAIFLGPALYLYLFWGMRKYFKRIGESPAESFGSIIIGRIGFWLEILITVIFSIYFIFVLFVTGGFWEILKYIFTNQKCEFLCAGDVLAFYFMFYAVIVLIPFVVSAIMNFSSYDSRPEVARDEKIRINISKYIVITLGVFTLIYFLIFMFSFLKRA